MKTTTTSALTLLALIGTPLLAQTTPTAPAFDPAGFATSTPNPFFPLKPGVVRTSIGALTDVGIAAEAEADTADEGGAVAEEEDDPAEAGIPLERGIRTVIGAGPEILGVQTVTIIDDTFEEGRIAERTFDYFVADKDGNIWYFGKDCVAYQYDDKTG